MNIIKKIKAQAKQAKQVYSLFCATVLFNKAKYGSMASSRSWLNNRAGKMGMEVVGVIIGLALGAYVVAYTIPDAVVAVTNETLWTGAPASVTTLGTLVLGIVIVIACIVAFLKMAFSGGD